MRNTAKERRAHVLGEQIENLLGTILHGGDSCQAAIATAVAVSGGPWYASDHQALSKALMDVLTGLSQTIEIARKECDECRRELRLYVGDLEDE